MCLCKPRVRMRALMGEMLSLPELVLNRSTVSAILSITPGHDGSVVQNGSKSSVLRGTDLLHLLQLPLHSTTVTTSISSTPRRNGSIAKNGSKSRTRGLKLLHILFFS